MGRSKRRAEPQPGDIFVTKACHDCGSPVSLKVVPVCEPMVLLMTGVCNDCFATTIAWDAMGGDMRRAAREIGDFFHQMSQELPDSTHH